MDARQTTINWDLEALREQLRATIQKDSDVHLLLSIAREEREGAAREKRPLGSTTFARKSKAALALAAHVKSGNTGVAALRRLAARGVLIYESTPTGHAILVDWSAVWRLSPQPSPEQCLIARHKGGLSGPVRACQGPPRVLGDKNKSRERDRDTVTRVPPEGPVRPAGYTPGIQARLVRPWHSRDGLIGEDLVVAVQSQDRTVLLRLYRQGIAAGWWQDCDVYRQRFLGCCWRAVATAKTSPMGLLHTLVALWLRDARPDEPPRKELGAAADDWADDTRRMWRRQQHQAEERVGADQTERGDVETLAPVRRPGATVGSRSS